MLDYVCPSCYRSSLPAPRVPTASRLGRVRLGLAFSSPVQVEAPKENAGNDYENDPRTTFRA
jgi:hypothetical protein